MCIQFALRLEPRRVFKLTLRAQLIFNKHGFDWLTEPSGQHQFENPSQLLTGRYTIRYGFQKGVLRPNQPRGIPLDEKLLPEALKDCGYQTEMFGKWHVGMYHEDYQPHRRGFDHFSGILTGGTDFYGHRKCFKSKKYGLQCGYDYRESFVDRRREDIRRDLKGVYSNDIIVNGKSVFLSEK